MGCDGRAAGNQGADGRHAPRRSPRRGAGNGGFAGTPADPVADCEYTFYALLALGCCV